MKLTIELTEDQFRHAASRAFTRHVTKHSQALGQGVAIVGVPSVPEAILRLSTDREFRKEVVRFVQEDAEQAAYHALEDAPTSDRLCSVGSLLHTWREKVRTDQRVADAIDLLNQVGFVVTDKLKAE